MKVQYVHIKQPKPLPEPLQITEAGNFGTAYEIGEPWEWGVGDQVDTLNELLHVYENEIDVNYIWKVTTND